MKGTAIVAFVTIKDGHPATKDAGSFGPGLMDDLKEHVVKKIGKIARPDEILFTADMSRAAIAVSCPALSTPRRLRCFRNSASAIS